MENIKMQNHIWSTEAKNAAGGEEGGESTALAVCDSS